MCSIECQVFPQSTFTPDHPSHLLATLPSHLIVSPPQIQHRPARKRSLIPSGTHYPITLRLLYASYTYTERARNTYIRIVSQKHPIISPTSFPAHPTPIRDFSALEMSFSFQVLHLNHTLFFHKIKDKIQQELHGLRPPVCLTTNPFAS